MEPVLPQQPMHHIDVAIRNGSKHLYLILKDRHHLKVLIFPHRTDLHQRRLDHRIARTEVAQLVVYYHFAASLDTEIQSEIHIAFYETQSIHDANIVILPK